VVLGVALACAFPAAQGTTLTGARELARAYEAVFDARFEALPALLAATCPPAPRETCQLMEVVALWWQIQLDPHDRSRDARFESLAEAAIGVTSAWTTREPMRAEAWFYLGGAYGARAQWKALRGEHLAAARDGKRIKEALERALALDPTMQDAYFGIGLYRYYADVAPTIARMFRWLLLLPGGNRAEGLQQMLRARAGGGLLASEADYQLALINVWYEKQPGRAVDLLKQLRARHPRNPHFPQLIAEIEDVNLGDPSASLRTWQSLLESATAGRVAYAPAAEARARLAISRLLNRAGDTAGAVQHLRAVIAARPESPYGALAEAHLQLGLVMNRSETRDDALASLRAALASLPPGDHTRIGDRARAAIRALPRSR
jgi:hypothetical protein